MKTRKKIKTHLLQPAWHKYVANKYNYFFISILFLIAAEPYLDTPHFPVAPLAFLLIILTLIWALKLGRGLFWLCLTLAIVACVFTFLSDGRLLAENGRTGFCFELLGLSVYILLLLIVIKVLLWNIFTEKRVTGGTIRGGLSIYFLMGIFWSTVYRLLLLIDPSAISCAHSTFQDSDLMYYSFVTMTTTGYGDIIPISAAARSMAILEATFGQIFITVFIARLVGLHLKGSNN